MRYFASENISVGSTNPVGPNPSLIDNSGGSRATTGLFTVYDNPIIISFTGTPAIENGHIYGPGQTFEVEWYDNLTQLLFITPTGTANIFASYGN